MEDHHDAAVEHSEEGEYADDNRKIHDPWCLDDGRELGQLIGNLRDQAVHGGLESEPFPSEQSQSAGKEPGHGYDEEDQADYHFGGAAEASPSGGLAYPLGRCAELGRAALY